VRLVDPSRRIRLPGGNSEPRTLVTYVRYPAARSAGRWPLIVFAHGYAVTPAPYVPLMRAWAQAGYVVAAPVFPLENANAPGGPNENDLINQPADVSFVITHLLAALGGLVDPARIAVAGHSDGGETMLAVSYDGHFRDSRVRAAVILSGSQIPGTRAFRFPSGGPPLLAVQGTADTINPPSLTHAFYDSAPRPKFLLSLLGAGHLLPYSSQHPQLEIVERVTIAFLDRFFKHGSPSRLVVSGSVPGVAELSSSP
jgi:fermentation-respiration switch protein FrsA (DUF1100 family)